MKTLHLVALSLVAGIALAGAAEPRPANEQTDKQFVALARELRAQQIALAENQAKIEAKLADVNEAVRVARIYSSRSH